MSVNQITVSVEDENNRTNGITFNATNITSTPLTITGLSNINGNTIYASNVVGDSVTGTTLDAN